MNKQELAKQVNDAIEQKRQSEEWRINVKEQRKSFFKILSRELSKED